MPEGPRWYPDDMVTDVEEAFWVAELVREQLLEVTREELPHSIACRTTEWEWPRIRVEILVERESQKPIVIGKKGSVLKEVGTAGAGPAARGRLHRAVREGRQGLAAPPARPGPPRLLTRRSANWSRIALAEELATTGLEVLGAAHRRERGQEVPPVGLRRGES